MNAIYQELAERIRGEMLDMELVVQQPAVFTPTKRRN